VLSLFGDDICFEVAADEDRLTTKRRRSGDEAISLTRLRNCMGSLMLVTAGRELFGSKEDVL
jgi:hypothetical protein